LANIKSAIKRAKKSVQQRNRNMALRSKLRTAIKQTQQVIAAGDTESATKSFQATQSVIDKMVTKGIIKKNRASGYKSKLNASLKSLSA
jgi:small subunit ribosomal protein S20